MTAKEVITKALLLLGYADNVGNTSDSRFQVVSKNAVNFVLADLIHCLGQDDYCDITSLADELKLPKRVLYDVMPYGVASFIAESVGDGEKQQFYANMYNTKRKTVVYSDTIKDVIPAP